MDKKFINPYNFMPLNDNGKSFAEKEDECLSGVIQYSLLTKTPLFIPNSSNDHAILPEEARQAQGNEYHKSYEFFAYEDLSDLKKPKEKDKLMPPVIPGSEMRGMIRSNYEILTNSCLSVIDDVDLTKRTPETFEAGLIRYDKASSSYLLYEAEDCLFRTYGENNLNVDFEWDEESSKPDDKYARRCYIQRDLQEGAEVNVYIQDPDRGKALIEKIANGDFIGYLIKGEDGPDMGKDRDGLTRKNQKHCAHVFLQKEDFPLSKVDPKVLDTVLRIYKETGEHAYEEYTRQWKAFKKGEGNEYFPVYYSSIDEKYYMLSPACITREVYQNKISQMLAGHEPCDDKNNLCPACALFGTVNTEKEFSVASRLRFSDLMAARYEYAAPVMLKELASPKIQNTEFYLRRPDEAAFWTFDYYIDMNGKVRTNVPTINGRKVYWHHPDLQRQMYEGEEKTIRNMTVRPLKKGSVFKGSLYFDRISQKDLDRLIYILNAGDDKSLTDKTHGYKLGAAKPYGFGSVAIHVDDVILRSLTKDDDNRNIQYSKDAYDGYTEPAWDKALIDIFRKVAGFNTLGKLREEGYSIEYPHKEKKGEDTIFNWFTENHKGYDRRRKKSINMPNRRDQVYVDEYLAAGKPEFRKTGMKVGRANDKNNRKTHR